MKTGLRYWAPFIAVIGFAVAIVIAAGMYGQRGVRQRLRGWEPLSDGYTYVRTVTTSGGLECLIVKSKHGSFGGISCR